MMKMIKNQAQPLEKNMCRMYIVRHGETIWNVEKRLQGFSDSPLTEIGLKQAAKLSQELKRIEFSHVFSSDLLRAKRTAEILKAEREIAVLTTQLLRERSFGKLEGKTTEEFRDALKDRMDEMEKLSHQLRSDYKLAQDMESDTEVVSRLLTFLRETAVSYPQKNVLVVTHSGSIRSLLIHLGHWSYKEFGKVRNLGYFILDSDGVDFFIRETHGIETLT